MKALSFAVCIGAALLAALCAVPKWRVVVHFEPDTHKREEESPAGGPYSQRLLDATWLTDTPVARDPVDRLRDVPSNFGPPRRYKASRRLLAAHCPVDIDAPNMGGEQAAEDILLTSGVAIRELGLNIARTGYNVVGCTNATFVAPADVRTSGVDLERHTLHFAAPKLGKAPPPEDMRNVRRSDSFFSNRSVAVVTSRMHSNAATASRVLQCHGAKTWFFLKPDCCNQEGHWVLSAATQGRGFPADSVFDVITTRPGDVLTFGPFQHHIVFTHAGPTFLRTDRIDAPLTPSLLFQGVRNFGAAFILPIVYLHLVGTGAHVLARRAPLGQDPRVARCDNAMDDGVRRALLERIEGLGLGSDA